MSDENANAIAREETNVPQLKRTKLIDYFWVGGQLGMRKKTRKPYDQIYIDIGIGYRRYFTKSTHH